MEVTTVPAAQLAYARTKDEILSGRLGGGTLLSEVDVARELHVSRTPVHEAFLRLASEDLLQLLPRRGALVVPVPPNESRDVLEVRVALEVAAVRRLSAGPEPLENLLHRLADSAAAQAAAARDQDLELFAGLDAEFHHAIVAASGNAIAVRFYESLGDRQRRMAVGAISHRPHRMRTLVREHRALAEHVGARDVAGFEAALERHLSATHDLLLGR